MDKQAVLGAQGGQEFSVFLKGFEQRGKFKRARQQRRPTKEQVIVALSLRAHPLSLGVGNIKYPPR